MYKLKSCPFCGGEAKLYKVSSFTLRDGYYVGCTKCNTVQLDCNHKERAVAAWNARAGEKEGAD